MTTTTTTTTRDKGNTSPRYSPAAPPPLTVVALVRPTEAQELAHIAEVCEELDLTPEDFHTAVKECAADPEMGAAPWIRRVPVPTGTVTRKVNGEKLATAEAQVRNLTGALIGLEVNGRTYNLSKREERILTVSGSCLLTVKYLTDGEVPVATAAHRVAVKGDRPSRQATAVLEV